MLELVLHLVSRSKLKVLEKIQQGTRYSRKLVLHLDGNQGVNVQNFL